MANKQSEKVSPYTLLNKWLYDGSKITEIPNEVLNSYSIGPQYILYFFRGSHYLPYIDSVFNNYYVYSLPKQDVFKLMKDIVQKTSFKPSFYKTSKKTSIKMVDALRKKYPVLKIGDANLLANLLESHEEFDLIQQCLGLKKGVSKKKTTKKSLKEYSAFFEEKTTDTIIESVEDEDDCVMEVDAEKAIRDLEEALDKPVSFENLLENFEMEV